MPDSDAQNGRRWIIAYDDRAYDDRGVEDYFRQLDRIEGSQEQLKGSQERIEQKLDRLLTQENTMADTLQNESDALTAEETTVSALMADVTAELGKFDAAQAAGVDTTPFTSRISAITATLKGLDQSVLASMPPLPVALPPASPAPTPAAP